MVLLAPQARHALLRLLSLQCALRLTFLLLPRDVTCCLLTSALAPQVMAIPQDPALLGHQAINVLQRFNLRLHHKPLPPPHAHVATCIRAPQVMAIPQDPALFGSSLRFNLDPFRWVPYYTVQV